MKRAESEDKDGSGSKGEKQQADYEVSKLPGAKKGESNQGGNVLLLRLPSSRSPSSSACIVCLFRCWFASPRFWSTDLAVTASDDRGIGEIAPRTPEDAAFTGEPEKGNKASVVPRPGDSKTAHCNMQTIGVILTEQL
ncbi:hypothetical protein Q7C36_008732 [Tachysurus vachellii]|uniref:Uncharacterized protein n=1 Tax=Tachysurus vachellii TaxID=175792 RepID=A0AA88N1V1_TACVA|nr:hypothetical protein Q7C36_008732 [Tachysurus vachellii]